MMFSPQSGFENPAMIIRVILQQMARFAKVPSGSMPGLASIFTANDGPGVVARPAWH